MLIQIAGGAAALAAANTHKSAEELGPLDVNGALLVLDFGPAATLESVRESIRTMDAFVGGLIADANDANDIRGLSALKDFICGAERDVEREFAYIMSAARDPEPIEVQQESHLQADTHAAIYDSSSSDIALDSNDEELKEDGKAHQGTGRRKR